MHLRPVLRCAPCICGRPVAPSHGAFPGRTARREQVRDELCMCGHRKSQHEDNVCGWWNCKCKQFEPLAAEKPRDQKPTQEFPGAGDIISANVAAQEVVRADVAAREV